MSTFRNNSRPRAHATLLALALALLLSSCGGGAGGAGPDGAGQGLVLITFLQDGLDNVALNTPLTFRFSEALDPASVGPGSIQIREGGSFGITVQGTYSVLGSTVIFEPRLPGLCDYSDSGFQPDIQYRVQLIGYPEQFALRNTQGQPLFETSTYEFHTRDDQDPDKFLDQIPATAPTVISVSPTEASQAVGVASDNAIVIGFSENIEPCSINLDTVLLHFYETGNPAVFDPAPNNNASGFSVAGDTSDQTPGDPFTWGAPGTTTLAPPQRILANIDLQQSFSATSLVITPGFGQFPEDALIVLQLTIGVVDFGGTSLPPFSLSFTTENTPLQTGSYVVENAGETPYLDALSTADIDTARSPSKIQGYMLFSGDGDNGADHLLPSLPETPSSGCLTFRQDNDGNKDDFDPGANVLLDTGSTVNTCPNSADGSVAVVWEFNTFRIRSGITVRVVGVNPAIFLVQGDVVIEPGARLMGRGDGQGGSPKGQGGGNVIATTTAGTAGGVGVAGGGSGGACLGGTATGSARYSGHGEQGVYYDGNSVAADVGAAPGTGGGHGNTSAYWQSQSTCNRNTPSGGGGSHATAGQAGTALGSGTAPTQLDLPVDGAAGLTYGDDDSRQMMPEAGSGGGAGAELRPFTGNVGRGPGGGGGAGGGFIDLTSGGNISVLGTIDVAGSPGGSVPTNGVFNPNYSQNPGCGGGGGGSGGGLRLLTPNQIILGTGAVLTAAGGAGGTGGQAQGSNPPLNHGGAGGLGRLTFEDADSVVSGLSGATVSPGEGADGFYRGQFEPTRFKGGGLTPQAVSDLFAVGPLNPSFQTPLQQYFGGQEDFIAGVPAGTSTGVGNTVILIEARGYDMQPDGTPDLPSGTGWYTVGRFKDSGVEHLPDWTISQPPGGADPATLPPGNVGLGLANVSGKEFIQIRVTIFLSSAMEAGEPGAFLDRWTIRFTHDQ